ncbi:hypothetical protein ABZW38_32355 [Streptomyces bacillaris]|uniref:hypothetical protein n=1 Tax=Streptomyces bacillaris TaxID=68179 RepID=UPI00345F381C
MRRLPDPVPPARHEIAASYISRLATIHGLDISHLWVQVTRREASGGMRRVVVPEKLAALTGRDIHDLAGAMPELRDPQPNWAMFRHQPQVGCHLCDAKYPGGVVTRLLPHHRYVCFRHRTWIGPPDINGNAADLSLLPAVVNAQRRHLRLMHRRGWALTFDAVLTGFIICGHIWDSPSRSEATDIRHIWEARALILIPPDEEVGFAYLNYSTSKLFAAVYPQAVGIAILLASPYWRRAADQRYPGRDRFFEEISRRITYPYSDDPGASDAIAHWSDAFAWRPPSRPIRTHSPARSTGIVPPASETQLKRDLNSGFHFASNRRVGSTLLRHNHIRPVIAREWRQKYERIDEAIERTRRFDAAFRVETALERAEFGHYLLALRTAHEASQKGRREGVDAELEASFPPYLV